MNATKPFSLYRGLPKPVYVMFIVRIVTAMGNFVYPFLTFFLTDRIGLSPDEAGTYFLVSAVIQASGSILGGKLTDHMGRKKLIIGAIGLSALCFVPCPFLGNSRLIPILVIVSGFFGGISHTVNSAMVTDLTCRENRKQAFSLLYLGINIGFAVGPIIAGFLYKNHTNWIFFGNITALTISMFLILLFVNESMPGCNTSDFDQQDQEETLPVEEQAEKGSVFTALWKRPVLLMFTFGKFINQLVYSCIGFAIPLQLKAVYGSSLGPSRFGIIMSFTGIVIIFCTMPLTHITIRKKPLINMSMASFFYAFGFGMIGFINTLPLYLLSAFIFTIGEILEATNAGVYIANHSPMTHRGRFNALISLITSTGTALGPYIFGKFISAYGLFYLWILCFVLTAFSGTFMLWLRYYERSREVI